MTLLRALAVKASALSEYVAKTTYIFVYLSFSAQLKVVSLEIRHVRYTYGDYLPVNRNIFT